MSGRISSFGSSYERSYQVQAMQSQLNLLMGEISSGEKANATAALGSSASLLYQLHAQSDQQMELQTSITTASSRLDTVQTALNGIASVTQTLSTAALGTSSPGSMNDTTLSVLATQAQGAIGEVLGQLNTTFAGSAVFAGDSAVPPMQSPGAAGGPLATVQATLSAAVTANGGPLTQSDVSTLVDGPSGISSVFNDTNSNPAMRYTGAFYMVTDDGNGTKVLTGENQTLQYNANADQPAFRDLLKGLSMLSLLDAPSGQLDDSAKSELLNQAITVIGQGQNELTAMQGTLGAVQSQMQDAVTQQQNAASATQQQILKYEQADTYGDSTKLNMLQTQIQASYELTVQIAQLSLVHYMPAGG